VLSGLEAPERSKPWELQPGNVLVEKDGTAYENDACKRRTRKVESDGSVTRYEWDCRDRLRSVVLPDGRLVEFTYDAFARRVRKVVTDAPKLPLAEALREALQHGAAEQRVVTTRFLWDGDVLCAELGEAGARVHVHEPGSFVPLLQAEGGAVYSVVTDHLGMPKELLDASGKVAWAAAHSAWGRVVEVQRDEGAAQVESPFRLLGQYHDEETGLAYTRFRYFDAEAGRWCSPDPLGITGGWNLGAFDDAPSAGVDPYGLACVRFKRWKLGEPIDKPMPDGSPPSWRTVRRRYWRNRWAASKGTGEFTDSTDIARMKRGQPPLDYNPRTGQMEPRELHHIRQQQHGGDHSPLNLVEVTPDQHAFVDPFRKIDGVEPSKGITLVPH